MKLLNSLKTTVTNVLKREPKGINEPIYLEKGAAFICKDKDGDSVKTLKINVQHIDHDLDDTPDFPSIYVLRQISKDGMIGMHSKKVLTLDTDDYPVAGSTKLINSGTLYNIIEDLQMQIAELQQKVNK